MGVLTVVCCVFVGAVVVNSVFKGDVTFSAVDVGVESLVGTPVGVGALNVEVALKTDVGISVFST